MREGSHTTTGTLPTRDFFFVLDPECIRQVPDPICQMAQELARIDPPLHMTFSIPHHFISSAPKDLERLGKAVRFLVDFPFVEQFTLASEYPSDATANLLEGDGASQYKALLGSAYHFHANGLVTARPVFLNQRHLLYQHHLITIIPFNRTV